MEPTKFKESNITFTAPGAMPDCGDLPAYRNQQQVITCWKASFLDRVRILFTGRVWIGIHGQAVAPMWLDSKVPFYRASLMDNIKYIIAEIREGFDQDDKQKHYIAGAAISAIVIAAILIVSLAVPGWLAALAGFLAGVIAGVVKDVVWDKWWKKGTFEIWDIVFTGLGSATFAVVFLALWTIVTAFIQ